MSIVTYLNGEPSATIDINDRGCMYGDGLFETMLACDGEIPLWQLHMKRLQAGCERLKIVMPDTKDILQKISRLINTSSHSIVKLIVTRGTGGRGYRVRSSLQPNVTFIVSERHFKPVKFWQAGVAVFCCQTRLAEQPALAGIKHLNRLEQILASQEWDEGYQEGLMCTASGQVIEATSHNLFAVKEEVLFTPDLQNAGVAGVMRDYVIELARNWQIPVYIQPIPYVNLADMDEVFLTNSIDGVWPVTRIGQEKFVVGPITRRIQAKVAEVIPYR